MDYRWLGAPADCPQCQRTTIPIMPIGSSYPRIEFELRYADFVQLLGSADPSVKKFIKSSFGYTVKTTDRKPRILNEKQEVIDAAWLHDRIQDDPIQRRELYGIAMSLWR